MKKTKIEPLGELSIEEQAQKFSEIIVDIYFQQLEEKKINSDLEDKNEYFK